MGEQTAFDDTHELGDAGLERLRVTDREAVHVEDHVAVVRKAALPINRLAAELHQFASDVRPRHGDHFDRKREGAEHRHHLRSVNDADEALCHRGDDLLAGKRRTAALGQAEAPIRLIRPVHIDRQPIDRVEIDDLNADGAKQARALLRARHGGFDGVAPGLEGADEVVDGRAGADADDPAVRQVTESGLGDLLLKIFAAHWTLPRRLEKQAFC